MGCVEKIKKSRFKEGMGMGCVEKTASFGMDETLFKRQPQHLVKMASIGRDERSTVGIPKPNPNPN